MSELKGGKNNLEVGGMGNADKELTKEYTPRVKWSELSPSSEPRDKPRLVQQGDNE